MSICFLMTSINVYADDTVYGYTYQSGREATKRIALDAKKRTIKGTETYSDVAIKGKQSNKIRGIGFGTKIKQEG